MNLSLTDDDGDQRRNSSWQINQDFFWNARLSDTGYLAVASFLVLLGGVAVVGNNIVLLVFWRQRLYRRPVNLFILNLAVSDLVVALFGHPLSAASAFRQDWILGSVGCKMYAFICYLCGCNGIMTHAAISYFRYVVMCKFRYVSKVSLKHVVTTLVTIWVYSLFWTVTPLVGWSSYEMEPYNVSCSLRWYGQMVGDVTYVISVFFFVFIAPLSVVGYSYYRIVLQARKLSLERLRTLSMPADIRSMFILNLERKVTWICFLMTVAFLVTWLPYVIISLAFAFGYVFESPAVILPTMFAKSSCAYNPFIYCFTHEKFRHAVFSIFCKCKNKVDIISDPNQDTRGGDRRLNVSVSYNKWTGSRNIFTASSFQDEAVQDYDLSNARKYVVQENVKIHMEPRDAIVERPRIIADFSTF